MSDFWARRKAAVQAEEREEALQVEAEAQAVREAELAERSDEDILAELDLPDPDTLEEGDDFKVFLSEAVPARIRTRALRRLWRLNPVLANVDGLVDYGEDFTDASCVVENLQTAYQVGKGMTQHVLEMARQAEEADVDDQPEADVAEPEVAEEEVLAAVDVVHEPVTEEAVDHVPPAPVPHVVDEADATDQALPIPARRMRFAFDVPLSGTST